MNIDDQLNTLKRIKPVEAPPFLFTRIQAQIRNLEEAPAPLKWISAFAFSAALLVALNVSVVWSGSDAKENSGTQTIGRVLELSNTNALYHE